MAAAVTEQVNRNAGGLDMQPPVALLRMLADAQAEAAAAPGRAVAQIAAAAEAAARALASGARLFYAAAGSSGLMALADALELPGTFGIPPERVVVLLAGGPAAFDGLPGGPEDDADQAVRDLKARNFSGRDCLVTLSASGSTPYAVAALDYALGVGARTIALANNAGSPLLEKAGVAILLDTPPEMIAGSTRMGAGTAQKIALNMLSTLVAVHLGHVHDGYMVNLHADNTKLRGRAARIVAAVAGCTPQAAAEALERAGGSVKVAILLACGARDGAEAGALLSGSGQKLRPALAILKKGNEASPNNRA